MIYYYFSKRPATADCILCMKNIAVFLLFHAKRVGVKFSMNLSNATQFICKFNAMAFESCVYCHHLSFCFSNWCWCWSRSFSNVSQLWTVHWGKFIQVHPDQLIQSTTKTDPPSNNIVRILLFQLESKLERAAKKFNHLSRIANAPDLDFIVPWSALILKIIDQVDEEVKEGTGSFITSKAILTAGHVICNDEPNNAPKGVSKESIGYS